MFTRSFTEEIERRFLKEFKEMINYRQMYMANNRLFAVNNLPVPESVTEGSEFRVENPKQMLVKVKGVEEPFFNKLNDTVVTVITDNVTVQRPRVDSEGKILKDTKGEVMYTKVTVPKDCAVIETEVNIALPNYIVKNGRQIKYAPKDKDYKYGTVRYSETENGEKIKLFWYIVPKSVLYRVHTVSLVLSNKPRKKQAYYTSLRVLLQNGAYVYISTMPTEKITDTSGTRIVSTKCSFDFDKEVSILLRHWCNTVAFRQADGRVFKYCFSKEESTAYVDGTTQNLAITQMDSVNSALDTYSFEAEDSYSLAEKGEETSTDDIGYLDSVEVD